MKTKKRQRLIAAWIANADAEAGTADYEINRWAARRLDDLIAKKPASGNDPQEAWEIILSLNERLLSDKATSLLAAGPLEDLLSRHGEAFIDRVEVQARRDPDFNRLLGGVWQNAMSEDVWQRVQAARNEVW